MRFHVSCVRVKGTLSPLVAVYLRIFSTQNRSRPRWVKPSELNTNGLTGRPFVCDTNGMASPGELVAVMAATLDVPRATVAQYDRVLAENGLRSSGGRGLSAAKVTAADAANLLIAIMGSPISGAAIKDAAQTCKLYAALRNEKTIGARIDVRSHELKGLAELPARHSLQSALVALIEGAMDAQTSSTEKPIGRSDKDQLLNVQLNGPLPWAQIAVFSNSRRSFYPRTRLTYSRNPHERRSTDLRQTRAVTFRTIRLLGATLKQAG